MHVNSESLNISNSIQRLHTRSLYRGNSIYTRQMIEITDGGGGAHCFTT